ncbi:MAG: hypothetical protein PVJ29_11550 [Desulfobacterales bacterium]
MLSQVVSVRVAHGVMNAMGFIMMHHLRPLRRGMTSGRVFLPVFQRQPWRPTPLAALA